MGGFAPTHLVLKTLCLVDAMPNVTLYTFATSPYGLKVQAYLAYKRVPYDVVYVDSFQMRRVLPVGHTVPVLQIDDESRNDSQVIAFGYELGLTGGDGLLRRPSIRAWALRVHAELDPAPPLVPPAPRVRSLASSPG